MWIDDELAALEEAGLRRTLRALPAVGGKLKVDGKPILNFSSNDYLNLAGDARLKAAAIAAIERYGCSATASRLMCGHLDLHEQLEQQLADLVGAEAALVFGSGFLTNLGVIGALAQRHDEVFTDRLNHASLVDGAALSGAKVRRYRHLDMTQLERLLQRGQGCRRRVIVTDSLFSMDGDIAPLHELQSLAKRYDAMLIVDEAHAFGVLGAGAGACKRETPVIQPDLVVGTMSKALGSYGGFAICSKAMRAYLVNRAHSFVYSTALAPANLAAALAAVQIIVAEPGLGRSLLSNADYFHGLLIEAGFDLAALESPIIPVPIGESEKAVALADQLWQRGILAKAIRPPTVPPGSARIRLTVTLAHSHADLERAAGELGAAAHSLALF
jgi:8-amino-7-oxononanoate synthase